MYFHSLFWLPKDYYLKCLNACALIQGKISLPEVWEPSGTTKKVYARTDAPKLFSMLLYPFHPSCLFLSPPLSASYLERQIYTFLTARNTQIPNNAGFIMKDSMRLIRWRGRRRGWRKKCCMAGVHKERGGALADTLRGRLTPHQCPPQALPPPVSRGASAAATETRPRDQED